MLEGRLSERIIKKITFINHPCLESSHLHKYRAESRIIIGIYGQAVNDNALSIIKIYNEAYDNGNIEFRIKDSTNRPILPIKNVKPLFKNDYVTNGELEKTIAELDYILIPYNRKQYMVSASGIFFDAVSQRIPLITLDSPFFKYYFSYDIGILMNNNKKLAAYLSHLKKDESAEIRYRNGMDKLYRITKKENISILKRIFSPNTTLNADTEW